MIDVAGVRCNGGCAPEAQPAIVFAQLCIINLSGCESGSYLLYWNTMACAQGYATTSGCHSMMSLGKMRALAAHGHCLLPRSLSRMTEGDHTANGLKGQIATEPPSVVSCRVRGPNTTVDIILPSAHQGSTALVVVILGSALMLAAPRMTQVRSAWVVCGRRGPPPQQPANSGRAAGGSPRLALNAPESRLRPRAPPFLTPPRPCSCPQTLKRANGPPWRGC